MEKVAQNVQNFEGLMVRLLNAGLDFVVIGGVCAAYYGYSVNTFDLDICCEFSELNTRKIYSSVADLAPVHRITPQRLPFEVADCQRPGLKNLYLGTSLGKLDCLSEVAGLGTYENVVKRSNPASLFGKQFRFLSIGALIDSKRATARPNDLRTIVQLEAIREALNTQLRPEQN
jgi:hypothetical protein